jgi:DNA-binding CsgD family transcriptional regulator/tetratricopeptide (TPR) repeat protein
MVAPWHTAAVARRVTCPTFVGHEADLRRLEEVADAATHAAQIVLVVGDAGVGKTRLINELCLRRRARGGIAAVGGCVDLGEVGMAYGPLLGVLGDLRVDLGPEELDRLVHDVAPELLPLLRGGHDSHHVRQGAVLAHTVALFEAVGDRLPGTIVVFEDVHWADASTRDLIAYLARNLRRAQVALLVSYRADDVHRRHPLRPLLAELTRIPEVEHLRLGPMSRSELTLLLAGVTGATPSDALVDEVMARSEGNPFYAEELLAAGAGADHLPDTLREAILARVVVLPEPVQAALRSAALLGEHIDERLLALVTGDPVDEVADALREAVVHHILTAEPRGCRFRHALVREALADDILRGERQHLHETAAAAIAAHPELAGDQEHVRWALLAHHWTAAQDQPHALAASVRAGIAAQHVGALAEAAAHFEQALDLWPRVPEPETEAGMARSELLVRAADAVSHAGAPSRAVAMVEAAFGLLDDRCSPEHRAAVLERLGHHRWVACDPTGSGEARQAAVALLADRPATATQALVLAAWGRHQMLVDRFIEAECTLRMALAVAEATDAQSPRSNALVGLGFTLVKLGRVDEGVDAARRSLEIAHAVGDADDIGLAYVNLTATLLAAGCCEEAARVAASGLEHARRAGMLASDGVLIAYGGADALCWLGRWDEAAAMLAGAAMESDAPHGTTGAVLLARIAHWQGRADEAASHCERALTVVDTQSEPAPEALVCAARLAADEGRYDEARRHYTEALAIVEATEDVSLTALVWATAMEVEADRVEAARLVGPRGVPAADEALGVAAEVRRRASEMITRAAARGVSPLPDTAAHVAVAEAEHERARGRHDPDQWAEVAGRWEALGFPYPAAVARFREADAVLRSRSSKQRAETAARTALAVAERLGAVPLADDVRGLAQRGRLDVTDRPEAPEPVPDPFRGLGVSPREGEVLGLLALGRTNRQIAEALFISEKTASVHVTNLLRKLNVASRVEAAAIAQQLGRH